MTKKLLIIGLVVSLLVNAVAIAVFAATDVEEVIHAVLNKSIRLTWNGEEFLPIDPVTHDRVYPIVYNGRTYIPARFIAEKAGVLVDWDDDTKTVSFNAKTDVQTIRSGSIATGGFISNTEPPKQSVPFKGPVRQFEGRIAIITNDNTGNDEEYRPAQMAVSKYGEDKVIHTTWPVNFMQEQEQMVKTLLPIAADPTIKALIINQSLPGTTAAVAALRKTRKDIFIVCCTPQENPIDISKLANLILLPDELGTGYTMVEQAAKVGAKVFVHYSFPRHMAQVILSGRREIIKAECARLGIQFVDATAPDPTGEVGVPGAQQFILEDVPNKIAEYGKDTAFFVTNCSMQIPLIKAASDAGAIYPQPCCPSPFHGFPTALGIEGGTFEMDHIIAETSRILKDKGVSGRFSTWPVPANMAEVYAGVEYAIEWINGNVPKEGLDLDALKVCMKEYTGTDVSFTAYKENGVTMNNYQLFLMDYLIY